MRRSFLAAVLAFLAQLALFARAPAASAADAPPPRRAAARVALVEGDVRFLDAYGVAERRPKVGDLLYEGDRIVTGRDGEVQLAMEDGGYIGVRPDSETQVVAFRADGRADDISVLSLAHGALRSVTGWIAAFGGGMGGTGGVIRTPNAFIGVRGTDHEVRVVPEGGGAEAGTYDRVYAGATVIQSREGALDVKAGQAGFAPFEGRARVLERIPDVFRPTRNEGRFQGLDARIRNELEKRRQERRSFKDREDRGERAERAERPERAEKVERVERVERVDKIERTK